MAESLGPCRACGGPGRRLRPRFRFLTVWRKRVLTGPGRARISPSSTAALLIERPAGFDASRFRSGFHGPAGFAGCVGVVPVLVSAGAVSGVRFGRPTLFDNRIGRKRNVDGGVLCGLLWRARAFGHGGETLYRRSRSQIHRVLLAFGPLGRMCLGLVETVRPLGLGGDCDQSGSDLQAST